MGERGQALLVVLLVMTVALTVGLSVATRSIVNVRIATQEEQSQRAFSAAEAGIEAALQNCTNDACPIPQPPLGGFQESRTTFEVSVNAPAGDQILLEGGNQIAQDEGGQVWLSAFGAAVGAYNGSLSVHWGIAGESECAQPAMEVFTLSGSKNAPTVSRLTFDPCASRRTANGMGSPTTGSFQVLGATFPYRATLPAIASGLITRVTPLYRSTAVGVSATPALPSQGFEITSVGTTLDETNPVKRKIRVFQSYPQLPAALFNYTLFSTGSLSQ